MIHANLERLLIEQIGHELTASNYYLGIATYFGSQSLDRWAEIFFKQSEEEREHALKIVRFLVDVGVDVRIPAVEAVTGKFDSPVGAIQWALENERTVTRQFHNMAGEAMDHKDFTSFQFLQWFLDEQVEEESSMQKLLDIMRSESNPFRAEELLPDNAGCGSC